MKKSLREKKIDKDPYLYFIMINSIHTWSDIKIQHVSFYKECDFLFLIKSMRLHVSVIFRQMNLGQEDSGMCIMVDEDNVLWNHIKFPKPC